MRIGIDLDGCLYDFVDALRHYRHDRYDIPFEDMPRETCWEFFWEDWGIPFAEFIRLCDEGVDDGYLFCWGDPNAEGVEVMHALRRDGHTIHIVTDRTFGTRSHTNTAQWLGYNDIPFDSLTFAADKTSVPTDAFIDDRPLNVDALRSAGCHAWLLDNGRKDQEHHPYLIPSWDEFFVLVTQEERCRKVSQ